MCIFLKDFLNKFVFWNTLATSAVHRSRRAGAGVLPYFAGAGAEVCSPPAKLRQHLFVLQTSIIDQRKTNFIDEKVNTA